MSTNFFELVSLFPAPDDIVLLRLLIQFDGKVVDFFKQRAIYHRDCWTNDTTIMLLRCLHGLLTFGYLDYGHLQAVFFKRSTASSSLFFTNIKQAARFFRHEVLNSFRNFLEDETDEIKINTLDQYKHVGIVLF